MIARNINPRTFSEKLDKDAFPTEVTNSGWMQIWVAGGHPAIKYAVFVWELAQRKSKTKRARQGLHDIISDLATAVSEVLSGYPWTFVAGDHKFPICACVSQCVLKASVLWLGQQQGLAWSPSMPLPATPLISLTNPIAGFLSQVRHVNICPPILIFFFTGFNIQIISTYW